MFQISQKNINADTVNVTTDLNLLYEDDETFPKIHAVNTTDNAAYAFQLPHSDVLEHTFLTDKSTIAIDTVQGVSSRPVLDDNVDYTPFSTATFDTHDQDKTYNLRLQDLASRLTVNKSLISPLPENAVPANHCLAVYNANNDPFVMTLEDFFTRLRSRETMVIPRFCRAIAGSTHGLMGPLPYNPHA